MNLLKPLSLILLMSYQIYVQAQIQTILIDDRFNSFPENWKEIKLNGAESGKYSVTNESLSISNIGKKGYYGFYNSKPVSGNFYAEVEFIDDNNVGLALIAVTDGKPDLSNFTLFCVNRREGTVFLNQFDRQNGVDNVHDPRQVIDSERYQAKLDGKTFSVPYLSTNGKIRILHESLSNTFHFYYGTRLDKWGIISNDWMEVAPQYSWLEPEQLYFVALVSLPASDKRQEMTIIKHLNVVQTLTNDIDDSETGFKAVRRNFSWSGFEGDATVISFGKEFGYDKNIKFVFWDRANNAPAWRLSNQFLLNFEFFESGDSVFPGCHEAMSDRQRHGQSVTILENNDVRKIIHWHGIPMNPEYNFAGENFNGKQLPYYNEYWTFYPDGTGTRQLIDMPNLNVNHRRSWGPEVIEPMVIGGSVVEAGDLCNAPALSVFNMTDTIKTFFPKPTNRENARNSWGWNQIIFDCHFKDNLPDFFIVYSQDSAYPECWTGIPIETQISWHNTSYNFSHWPVGREPYGQNAQDWGKTSRSYSSHLNEVTHTSLASAGFYGKLGVDFNDHFQVDSIGRKFRRHTMLFGSSKPYDYDEIKNQVQTWLDPGKIIITDPNCEFLGIDRLYRTIVLRLIKGTDSMKFKIIPNKTIINPSLTITNWKGNTSPVIQLNGERVESKTAIIDNTLLVWISSEIAFPTEISIGTTTYSNSGQDR